MLPSTRTKTTAVATAVALGLAGGAYATAASTSGQPGGNPDETPLTGETAAKVKAAALAEVPGATILRVETDEGGVYEAHVRKSDGMGAEVKVDRNFTVTAVETRPGGRGGPGGRHIDTAALAGALGVTEARLRTALDATRPAKPAGRPEGGFRARRAAAIAKALGESTADVQTVMEANRPDRFVRGARPDQSALVAALAKEFSVSTEKAQAAVDAAKAAHRERHEARRAARATALAQELGLSTEKVRSALKSVRPVKRG